MSLFKSGPIVQTMGISILAAQSTENAKTIERCLNRHLNGDWGDLCEEDKQMNQDSLEAEKNGGYTDSLFSQYTCPFGDIYIITECDRSVTTILLAEEY